MGVQHDTATVGTSATKISLTETVRSPDRQAQSVLVTADADIFVGGPGVTTTDYGYKVATGSALALDLGASDDSLYAVAAAPATAHILYLGV